MMKGIGKQEEREVARQAKATGALSSRVSGNARRHSQGQTPGNCGNSRRGTGPGIVDPGIVESRESDGHVPSRGSNELT